MIFVYLDLLQENFLAFVVFFGAVSTALVVGLSFHEFSHAIVADSLGDPLPRRLGRVSLNPLAHLDPTGTLLLFLVGFGWGKPVPVNAYALRNGVKSGMALVAGAGPLSNFLMAAAAGLPLKLGWVPWLPAFDPDAVNFFVNSGWNLDEYLGLFLSTVVLVSIILGVFNLIPLFPLDGHRVVPAFLTDASAENYMRFQARYGIPILIVLIALPFLTAGNFGILFEVMRPIINGLSRLFAGIDHDVFA
ncbi:MAG TPA: site-2 protease family protein [Dehalococcoidia bacterium]|nr:site-2 protease family protein [Dehalococcoidia bacterium]